MEKLLSKDIEIIFMTDSVDEYTVHPSPHPSPHPAEYDPYPLTLTLTL